MNAVFLDNKRVWLEKVAEPSIQSPYDVKVKISYASICGYDMMVYRGNASPDPEYAVGHESSGVVVETGSGVTRFSKGDKVALKLHAACGSCTFCRKNLPAYCFNLEACNMQMREFVVCNQNYLQLLDNKVSLKSGCQIEPLSMAMCTLQKADLSFGKSLLIIGGGAMGQLMVKLAVLSPVSRIAVSDPHQEKREKALSFGASHVFDPKSPGFFNQVMEYSEGIGFDNIIEASGNRSSARMAFHFLARGGRLIYYGLYGMNYELPLNLFNLYWKDAFISAVYPSTTNYQEAADLAPRLALEELITAIFPFEQAAKAFAEKATGKHAKVVLDFTDHR